MKKKKEKGRYNYRSFEEYWDVSSYWLHQITWLNDFGNQMTEENRNELTKQCEVMKPIYPIDQHKDILVIFPIQFILSHTFYFRKTQTINRSPRQ